MIAKDELVTLFEGKPFLTVSELEDVFDEDTETFLQNALDNDVVRMISLSNAEDIAEFDNVYIEDVIERVYLNQFPIDGDEDAMPQEVVIEHSLYYHKHIAPGGAVYTDVFMNELYVSLKGETEEELPF